MNAFFLIFSVPTHTLLSPEMHSQNSLSQMRAHTMLILHCRNAQLTSDSETKRNNYYGHNAVRQQGSPASSLALLRTKVPHSKIERQAAEISIWLYARSSGQQLDRHLKDMGIGKARSERRGHGACLSVSKASSNTFVHPTKSGRSSR